VLRTIWQNIIGAAFIFNAIGVVLASMGWISPIVAAVMHQVSSLLVCLNSLRLLADWGRCRARLAALAEQAWARRRRIATAGGVALLVLWLLSGVHFVSIGQVAVVQRFGRVVLPLEQPGLHVRLPWPFARHTTVDVGKIRRVEIGFRTLPGDYTEPAAYEWNLQHRGGRNERRPEEADVWTGDHKLVDVTLVVHYRIASPLAAPFQLGQSLEDGQSKWDTTVRAAAESSLRATMSRRRADDILSENRAAIETEILELTQFLLTGYKAGIEVTAVCLGDVHPPLEVVPDYRDVAKAMGEKEAKINEAQADANETEALAQGQASERETEAEAFAVDREERAAGQAERFAKVAEARAAAPELTKLRLYLETIEQALAGRRKIILDRAAGRGRRLLYLGRKGLWAAPPPAPPEPEGTIQP
jgi:membrane protease subunit HflK